MVNRALCAFVIISRRAFENLFNRAVLPFRHFHLSLNTHRKRISIEKSAEFNDADSRRYPIVRKPRGLIINRLQSAAVSAAAQKPERWVPQNSGNRSSGAETKVKIRLIFPGFRRCTLRTCTYRFVPISLSTCERVYTSRAHPSRRGHLLDYVLLAGTATRTLFEEKMLRWQQPP